MKILLCTDMCTPLEQDRQMKDKLLKALIRNIAANVAALYR